MEVHGGDNGSGVVVVVVVCCMLRLVLGSCFACAESEVYVCLWGYVWLSLHFMSRSIASHVIIQLITYILI